ncbi:MAG: diaminopimelate decarboxylase [Betaproteobacteria bacterium]|nr:diaminopimelate decarboxylase [Betaproteobacteria bacterium]
MSFEYRNGRLCAEDVPLEEIAARYGTPCFVYSRRAIEAAYAEFVQASAGREVLVCYAVKANSNLAVLGLLARLGAGFDIVSGGELARVLAAGGNPRKVVFSGVGKTEADMRAALQAGVLCFNVESEAELERLDAVARSLGVRAPVSLRVNPDVDARTHPYISTGLKQNKFGIAYAEAPRVYRKAAAMPGLHVAGIDVHIGSQITETRPFVDALHKVLEFVDVLEATGIPLEHIDLGGGLGIRYRDEAPPRIAEYLGAMFAALGSTRAGQRILLEPGRALVGNAGILLTKVEYLKRGEAKNFAIVDAAMNDLIRPALYEAWHEVKTVKQAAPNAKDAVYDVVGPVCETGDFLAQDRTLAVQPGDLLAVMSAGAYGMVMSSNYNSRPRAAEVLVSGGEVHLARRRETLEELYAQESMPKW